MPTGLEKSLQQLHSIGRLNVVTSQSNLRQPAHPSITEEQISRLVDEFYTLIQTDSRLGPIFETQVAGNWPPHLDKMKSFWRSVLLKTGEYKGRPVPAHAKIPGLKTDDFRLWLRHFRSTAENIFAPDAQPIVLEISERIASSLWLSRSKDLFAAPPDWNQDTQDDKEANT